MIKIESFIAKLLLILSALFAVIMIKHSFENGEMEGLTEAVNAVPTKKYYIPALRRRY